MRVRTGITESRRTEVQLGDEWDVVGPFPSGTREHPMTGSPLAAFPLDPKLDPDVDFARRPFSTQETFPSVIGSGGRVGWSKFRTDRDDWVSISYPDINWDRLRSDHGWVSLQYQVVLRQNMVVPATQSGSKPTSIRVELVQGVEFAFIPLDRKPQVPTTWYMGDIYNFADTPSGSRTSPSSDRHSNFARVIELMPGKYTVLVKAIYEIRMFGDPGPKKTPTINLCFKATISGDQDKEEAFKVVEGLRVVPDVVNEEIMGGWISVPVRLDGGEGTLRVVRVEGGIADCIDVGLAGWEVIIHPGQIRPISMRLKQSQAIKPDSGPLKVTFHLGYRGQQYRLDWTYDLQHVSSDTSSPFTITFASPQEPEENHEPSLVSYATVVPPKQALSPDAQHKPPVLLGLHGAGVDVENPFWAEAIPSIPGMWAVLPTGKNEWGEDWHGGSMDDVWAARGALTSLLGRIGKEVSDQTLLAGHSNGGQGAWHSAARWPDRIVGVIAASGWLKVQDYVPYTSLTSTNYADPALMGLLQSSLTPYNNDLYASNLARLPVLAVHGSHDVNVPPRHSRQHVALVQAWEHDPGHKDKPRKLVEVPKKGHWWGDVLKQPEVYEFINALVGQSRDWAKDREAGYTLTTGNPDESGARSGVRILELETPGRMARLDVNGPQWEKEPRGEEGMFHGMNVRRFSYQPSLGAEIAMMRLSEGVWAEETTTHKVRRYGPMIRSLATNGPMRIVVDASNPRLVSIARRYAHDLYVYHRIAVNIVSDREVVDRLSEGRGNIVSIGRPDQNTYTAHLLAQKAIPLTFPSDGVIDLAGRTIYELGSGVIALHPHPDPTSSGLAAIVAGNDDGGLELAARLLPIRTGVPVPDWAVIGSRSRWQAAGGIIGAGFWDGEWQFSEKMSWIDR